MMLKIFCTGLTNLDANEREEQKTFDSTFALKKSNKAEPKRSQERIFQIVFDAELKETQFNKLLICFGASSPSLSFCSFCFITIFFRLFRLIARLRHNRTRNEISSLFTERFSMKLSKTLFGSFSSKVTEMLLYLVFIYCEMITTESDIFSISRHWIDFCSGSFKTINFEMIKLGLKT
jgi:hypothetical protein